MLDEDKYYYIKRVNIDLNWGRDSKVVKWHPEYQVDVDEEVEYYQYISVCVNKLGQKGIEKPSSSKYEKVKPIIREIFLEHYSLAVRNFQEYENNEGECYIHHNSKDWIVIRYFSINEKQKLSIEIDFRNSIDDLWLMIHREHGHKHRPTARKNGTAISLDDFHQFLHLTAGFLSDSDSFLVFVEDYIKNMRRLSEGEEKITGLLFSSEKSFETIIEQLNKRKKAIEMRLIDNDADPANERANLRGELKGIDYAISTIEKFR